MLSIAWGGWEWVPSPLAPAHPCAGLMGSERTYSQGRLSVDQTVWFNFPRFLGGGLSQQFSLLSPWKLQTALYAAHQGLTEGLQRGEGSSVPVGMDLLCRC